MRKLYSIFNMLGTLGTYIVTMIFNFIVQAIIIRKLGIEYSGINGLFSNILTMLSVAELGVGSAISFKLYKPVAEDNIEEIKSWLKFYKICYCAIAIFIGIMGMILIPFLPNLIGEVSIKENIIILYILSLMDIVFSYLFTYKRSLLYAKQKNYIVNVVHIGYVILMNLTQIIFLNIYKNYTIFLIIKVVYRVIENIIINVYINIKYKYVKEKAKNITTEERKDIFARIMALFLQKVSFVVNKGIDNILITSFLGIVATGYYSNYNLIVSAITSMIYQIISSMTASVGNLLTENNRKRSYLIYKRINLLNSFITGIFIIGFVNVIQPFISIWIGSEYMLSVAIVIAFASYIYADSIRRAITMFKTAAGICKEDKYAYLIMIFINIIFSVILGKFVGMIGIILGTVISYLFLILYSYPKYIFKPLFKKNYRYYYIENAKYLIFIILSTIISYTVIKYINLTSNVLQLIVNGCISVFFGLIIFIIMFRNSEEFKYYIELLRDIKNKMIKEKQNGKV